MTVYSSRVFRQYATLELLWAVAPDESAFRDWEGLIRGAILDADGIPGVCVLTDVADLESGNGAAARLGAEVPGQARAFARALLDLWGMQGGECSHGVGFDENCPGGDDEGTCAFNDIRPLLREAQRLLGEQ